jgi:hypothetical protein
MMFAWWISLISILEFSSGSPSTRFARKNSASDPPAARAATIATPADHELKLVTVSIS